MKEIPRTREGHTLRLPQDQEHSNSSQSETSTYTHYTIHRNTIEHKQKQQKHPMCIETTNRHLESQFGLTITFFQSWCCCRPEYVYWVGWGPLGIVSYSHAKVGWTAQWSMCRAGGAAGPHWPRSPMLHGYRGLYGSPRTAWWTAPTWVVTRGGRAANHAVAHLAGGDAKYIWLNRQ